MSKPTSKDSIELIRPFLVIKDSIGKSLCIVPKHITSIVEVSNGVEIETVSGSEWFVRVSLKDLIDKIEESNYLF